MKKLIDYLKGVKAELKNVTWPTKNQTVNATLLVIGASIVVALFLGAFDILFAGALKKFILK